MAFVRPSLADLVTRIQQDLMTRLSLTGTGLRRSVIGYLASAYAAAVHLLHGHLEYLAAQLFPDTSDADFLVRQAATFGLTRTPATFATGEVVLTGDDDAVVPAGSQLQRADGVVYATDAEATIATGTATVVVTALEAGAAGNAEAGVTLTLVAPVSGVAALATVDVGGLVDGADEGTDADLRADLLARLREPVHGGTRADYERWALENAGVTRAWVSPQELAANGVTVRFVRDGDGTGSAIIPDSGDVATVQAYLDARRPVTADVTVIAPTPVDLDVDVSITPDTATIRAAVEAELTDLLARLAEPGGTIPLSQIQVAIGVAAGVEDFTITDPVADVTHATGEMAVLGTVTFA